MKARYLFLSTTLTMGLAGCGSSGGGANFTSWNVIVPPASVVASGIAKDVGYTIDLGGTVTSVGAFPASAQAATYSTTYDAMGVPTRIAISTPTDAVSWRTSAGDGFVNLSLGGTPLQAVVNAAGTSVALAADPYMMGWNYQSFGVWDTGYAGGTGRTGVASVGAPTPGVALPTINSATFNGATVGFYLDSGGTGYLTTSQMTAVANFPGRSVALTSASTLGTQDLVASFSLSSLDFTGTLTYAAGANALSGTVTTSGGMSGPADARFYGPAAEEIGGIFAMRGVGTTTYGGAFGGRR